MVPNISRAKYYILDDFHEHVSLSPSVQKKNKTPTFDKVQLVKPRSAFTNLEIKNAFDAH